MSEFEQETRTEEIARIKNDEIDRIRGVIWLGPDPSLCPARVQSSLEAYVRGLPPGDFVRAVLSNDLNEAIARADDVNIHALPHIVAYCRERLPAVAWGSSERVNRWLSKGRDSTRTELPPVPAHDPLACDCFKCQNGTPRHRTNWREDVVDEDPDSDRAIMDRTESGE
jgi:hypothetical protein